MTKLLTSTCWDLPLLREGDQFEYSHVEEGIFADRPYVCVKLPSGNPHFSHFHRFQKDINFLESELKKLREAGTEEIGPFFK